MLFWLGLSLVLVGLARLVLPRLSKLRFAARGGETLPAESGEEPLTK